MVFDWGKMERSDPSLHLLSVSAISLAPDIRKGSRGNQVTNPLNVYKRIDWFDELMVLC